MVEQLSKSLILFESRNVVFEDGLRTLLDSQVRLGGERGRAEPGEREID
jgi:hypothetical protein